MPVIERAKKATVAKLNRWEGACSWAKSGNLPECVTKVKLVLLREYSEHNS